MNVCSLFCRHWIFFLPLQEFEDVSIRLQQQEMELSRLHKEGEVEVEKVKVCGIPFTCIVVVYLKIFKRAYSSIIRFFSSFL